MPIRPPGQTHYTHYALHSAGRDEECTAAFRVCWLELESIKKKKSPFTFKDCHLLVIKAFYITVNNLGLLNQGAINPSVGR